MTNHPLYEKIEAYLYGKLSPEDQTVFEQQISNDQDLATQVELQRLEHDATNQVLEEDLKVKTKDKDKTPASNPFDQPSQTPAKKKPVPFLTWVLIGILALILFFFVIQPFLKNGASTTEDLLKVPAETLGSKEEKKINEPSDIVPQTSKTPLPEGVKPKAEKPKTSAISPATLENENQLLAMNSYGDQPVFSNTLRSENQESSTYKKAVIAFNDQNYQQALKLLGPSSKEDESYVRYLRGHIYFQIQEYEKALPELRAVAENEFAPSSLEAEWYLLLTLMATYPTHIGEFEILAVRLAEDQSSAYSNKTRALLVKLAKLQQ